MGLLHLAFVRARRSRALWLAGLVSLAILVPGERASAVTVLLRWEHPVAERFLVYSTQPSATGLLTQVSLEGISAKDDATKFSTLVEVGEPTLPVSFFITALDDLDRESGPSDPISLLPHEFCGGVDCDDGIACTVDFCRTVGVCEHAPRDLRCDDGNPCTLDGCFANFGCSHSNLSSGPCDDGLACTVADTCFAGGCAGAVDCRGGGECDLDTGACKSAPPPTTTTTTTTIPPGCGDGVVNGSEECDDGDQEWAQGEACLPNCTLLGCGDPDGSGTINPADALLILRSVVGLGICDPSVCNVDNAGPIGASDALRILRLVVGVPLEIACPSHQ